MEHKCLCCNKNYQKKFDENLKKRFFNTYKIFNNFILFLRKSVYLLPEKEYFYSHVNMEDTTDASYTHEGRVSKDFKINNFGEYHDLGLGFV